MAAKMPASDPAARKLGSSLDLAIVESEGAAAPRNPSDAKPIMNNRICFGSNPLEVNHFTQRYSPTKEKAVGKE